MPTVKRIEDRAVAALFESSPDIFARVRTPLNSLPGDEDLLMDAREAVTSDMEKILAGMTQDERDALLMLGEGLSYKDTAEVLCVDLVRVRHAIESARTKAKQNIISMSR